MIVEGEGPKIKGSIMLAFAESKEDVIKALQDDVYFEEGVWDWKKAQIHPVCQEVPRSHNPSFPLMIVSSSLLVDNRFRKPVSKMDLKLQASSCRFIYR